MVTWFLNSGLDSFDYIIMYRLYLSSLQENPGVIKSAWIFIISYAALASQ